MTRRLYYEDAYTTEFRATVTTITRVDEQLRVALDATLFYPTSGGQMHDLGTLGGLEVTDVQDAGETIVHVLGSGAAPFAVGDTVEGSIDTERRRDHRQQHTGQHVLSRVVEDRLGLPTISSRLGETMNTLDLETPGLTSEQLEDVEDLANATLWQGHDVWVHLVDETQAEAWGLRKKVERPGPVRIIEVEGVDKCACGGTHVAHTAEVGEIVIVGTEKAKNLTRVNFLCGQRAHVWRRQRHQWLDGLARDLTTGHPYVGETVSALVEESKARQKRLVALARELVVGRVESWLREARDFESDGENVQLVARQLDPDESLAAAEALHQLISRPATLAALVAIDGDKGQLMIARSEALRVDCRDLLRRVLEPVGGKGGGRPENVRGGFASVDTPRVLRALGEL